ncbi:MAG: 50S ribosomal protein L3 [Candidatus Brocadiia bacterium]
MNGILAKKIGMTQVFREDGNIVPVTVLEAGPCPILQVKTAKNDGYNALQIGFDAKRKKNSNKALMGHFKKAGLADPSRYIREFRFPNGQVGQKEVEAYKIGDQVKVDIFEGAYKVTVTGISKGRGFMGMIVKWNKHRGPESHGSMQMRAPGSIGSDTRLTHIRPGKHMPGHYGVDTITVENLEVVKIDKDRNLMYVRGAVPGANNGLIEVYKTDIIKKVPVVTKSKKAAEQRKKR